MQRAVPRAALPLHVALFSAHYAATTCNNTQQRAAHDRRANGTSPIVHVVKYENDVIITFLHHY